MDHQKTPYVNNRRNAPSEPEQRERYEAWREGHSNYESVVIEKRGQLWGTDGEIEALYRRRWQRPTPPEGLYEFGDPRMTPHVFVPAA